MEGGRLPDPHTRGCFPSGFKYFWSDTDQTLQLSLFGEQRVGKGPQVRKRVTEVSGGARKKGEGRVKRAKAKSR